MMRRVAIALGFTMVMVSAAHAIDFTTQLHAIGGGPFRDDKGQPTELLLGTVAENALLAPDAADTTGEAKLKSFLIAVKLHDKDGKFAVDVKLSAEEIAKIKDKVGKLYPVAVVGAAWMALDPASAPK